MLQERGVRQVHRVAAGAHAHPHRKKSPQTNGVIERYHGAIKIEQLWRELPADGTEMTRMVDDFRQLYNEVRPHEALGGQRPLDRYLAAPAQSSSDAEPATLPTRQNVWIT